ncbi:DoxX family protein [Pseudalkalibacillus berkeleyi]|uniref:DoxX family protein n=1 Tax=Pseudalkalibacillus berkeleyi TaxID=1069813 RepID=A0ABS9GUV1_9BACL|nr:DoxX family protein [Pseudalkalibacillus berkeleyi]MCF6136618.1 DoxX family protein [Pseudalkalibacillus berkeleyi]
MVMKNEIGALVLRIALGIIFFVHGLSKFQGGIENVAGWFSSIGLPGFLAYAVAIVELVGGIALILGLGTRVVSAMLGIIMLVAIFKVKLAAGFMGNGEMAGYEFDLALLAMSVYLTAAGSKLFAVDEMLFNKEKSELKETA